MSLPGHSENCFATANYKGAKSPTDPKCLECWRIYFAAHLPEPVTCGAMYAFCEAIRELLSGSNASAMRELVNRITHECD